MNEWINESSFAQHRNNDNIVKLHKAQKVALAAAIDNTNINSYNQWMCCVTYTNHKNKKKKNKKKI